MVAHKPDMTDVHKISLKGVAYHTKWVSLTKAILVLLGLILILVLLVLPNIDQGKKRVSLISPMINKVFPLINKMTNPRFMGITSANYPYDIQAVSAVRIDNGNFDVEGITADVTLSKSLLMQAVADKGHIYAEKKAIELMGHVDILLSNGLEFRTEQVHIDMDSGTAYGQQPVEVQNAMGTLYAKGFMFNKEAKNVDFTGPVKLVFYPQKKD
ncbi:MAG: LPS export ABC transporter periplasmic protein LptC [Alphaproteobacteria bacterium]|nr:LPS export ABC transporter periplasmic protein LptC [Alphaproteobacteria bacterium]